MQISFVQFDRRFLDLSAGWLSDPEIKALTLAPDFTREEQLRWFESLPRPDYAIWGVLCEGVPIGATGLKHITPHDAEYWGYIGEKRYWGLGIGRAMLVFCLSEAKKRNLKSVYLKVAQSNARAISLYKKMGFATEFEDGIIVFMRRQL